MAGGTGRAFEVVEVPTRNHDEWLSVATAAIEAIPKAIRFRLNGARRNTVIVGIRYHAVKLGYRTRTQFDGDHVTVWAIPRAKPGGAR